MRFCRVKVNWNFSWPLQTSGWSSEGHPHGPSWGALASDTAETDFGAIFKEKNIVGHSQISHLKHFSWQVQALGCSSGGCHPLPHGGPQHKQDQGLILQHLLWNKYSWAYIVRIFIWNFFVANLTKRRSSATQRAGEKLNLYKARGWF